jgi:hypothetical protein
MDENSKNDGKIHEENLVSSRLKLVKSGDID